MRSFSTCLTVQVGLLIALTALTRPSLAQSIDTFSAPGASETYPAAINEFGRVVGYYDDGSRHLHGFVRTAFGTMTTFDAPSVGDGHGTEARVINAAGQIAGSVSGLSAGDLVMRGFVRDALGRFTEFDAGPAAIRTTPQAINAEGQIAGVYLDANFITHGFVRSAQGFITTFDAPAEFLWGIREIRPNGDVIGVGSRSNFGFYGFVRKPSGAFTTFDAPEVSPNTGLLRSLRRNLFDRGQRGRSNRRLLRGRRASHPRLHTQRQRHFRQLGCPGFTSDASGSHQSGRRCCR